MSRIIQTEFLDLVFGRVISNLLKFLDFSSLLHVSYTIFFSRMKLS